MFCLPVFFALSLVFLAQAARLPQITTAGCKPFYTSFTNPHMTSETSFVAITANDSYKLGEGGLRLYLTKPQGEVTTENGVNNKVAEGATVNSTFTLLYGIVTFELQAPTVPGIVTAGILIANQNDEIDVEVLGADPHHFQSNIFAPQPTDKEPLWAAFSSVDSLPDGDTIGVAHNYTIDWNEDRIIWSVDDKKIRTLQKDQTMHDSKLHYPSHPARISLGIWDASSPAGTAQWARGPVDWSNAPGSMQAVVRSLGVECPYGRG